MKKFITLSDFAQLLMTILGSCFVQVQSITEPKLNKKSRSTGLPIPFAKVVNCRDLNIQLGYDYEAQVNRNANKEGIEADFEAQEHVWARRIEGALARHKDYTPDLANLDVTKLYIPYKVMNIREQSFIADGKQIAKDMLLDYLPPVTSYDNQPAEKKVSVQYMKLSSVKEFRWNGIQYQIVG